MSAQKNSLYVVMIFLLIEILQRKGTLCEIGKSLDQKLLITVMAFDTHASPIKSGADHGCQILKQQSQDGAGVNKSRTINIMDAILEWRVLCTTSISPASLK